MTAHRNGRALMLALARPRETCAVRIARAVGTAATIGILIAGGAMTLYYIGLAAAAIARWAAVITLGG